MNLLISRSNFKYRVLASEQREYNRIMQQRRREREKEIKKLYQDPNVAGISYTEFAKQFRASRWQKLSIALSDEELKISKLSYKLSDEQLRLRMKKRSEKQSKVYQSKE